MEFFQPNLTFSYLRMEPISDNRSTIEISDQGLVANFPSKSSIEIGEWLIATRPHDINLIPLTSEITKTVLRQKFPIGQIFVCDFYVEGMENDSFIGCGFQDQAGLITNIDHHSPSVEMFRPISSGNLAIEYVNQNGKLPAEAITVINHTDCDSIISSLIMRGYLPPDQIFYDAVIAADHTGEENPIADLLQALDVKRSINFSVRNLANLLIGKELEPEAKQLLAARLQGRRETADALKLGAVIQEGLVTVVKLTENMRNEFMPALFPKAAVILTYETGSQPDSWVARCRLGLAAPAKFTLFSLNLKTELDPNMGGRWNATANKRGGETTIPLDDYIARLYRLTNEKIASL